MAKALQRTPLQGPAFIRLLAGLTSAAPAASSTSLSERLSEWLDWTRAVALSRALDGRLSAHEVVPSASGDDVHKECERVRAVLVARIHAMTEAGSAPPRSATAVAKDEPALEFGPLRERYRDLQQSMQAEVGRLRGHLRDMLASGSADMARLAEVDAVMELTLTPREHALLGSVPALLGQHFERLRDAAVESRDPLLPSTQAPEDAAWLDRFRQDMGYVLLAELDIRFQPVEGLLSALGTR
ncbi:DUF3348 domain-containing protein [Lysobacter sp. H21R4]|uniref:DUF3348 domain-containing protein n=1 Tax=Lysobacter sp. H21R4 TaxID=2781021 RepID=UPI0018875CCC|nr:DUF3348 domain-containing protein [Lysobacter sp. H21R4]QOY63377.1 DUF3348 domain-containing protein [Lysobacter sp. H21R4]